MKLLILNEAKRFTIFKFLSHMKIQKKKQLKINNYNRHTNQLN